MAADAGALAIAARTSDSCVVLTPCGRLDSSTYRALRDQIIKAALDEPRAVLVDVSGLEVPAESAWAVFTSARWHVTRWPDVPVVLVCNGCAGRSALRRNGITRYLPVYETVAAAVDDLDRNAMPRMRRRARAELTASLAALQRSRQLVDEWLSAWARPDLIPVAKVVVTALVENVLQHTDGNPGVRVESNGSTVTIAVSDQNTTVASFRETPAGRVGPPSGLHIVAALCRAWGNAPTPTGKAVWAVIGPENTLP